MCLKPINLFPIPPSLVLLKMYQIKEGKKVNLNEPKPGCYIYLCVKCHKVLHKKKPFSRKIKCAIKYSQISSKELYLFLFLIANSNKSNDAIA